MIEDRECNSAVGAETTTTITHPGEEEETGIKNTWGNGKCVLFLILNNNNY